MLLFLHERRWDADMRSDSSRGRLHGGVQRREV